VRHAGTQLLRVLPLILLPFLPGAEVARAAEGGAATLREPVLVAQSWKRHAPWRHVERAARRLDQETRKATRKGAKDEPKPRSSAASGDADRTRVEPERAPEPRAGEATAEPTAGGGLALAAAALAAAALAATAAAALAGFAWRRRRDAQPEDVPTRPDTAPGARGATTVAATLAGPVAPPAPLRAKAPFDDGPRYEILERIGAGGMGVVYRARDRRLSREVALKRLSEQLFDHPKAVGYFLREARAAAGLSHPNIVTVFDVDEEDGVPFLTMELLQGRNLSQIVADQGPLSSVDTARIGAQAAAGLACAHERDIVHRDVKSANLFLTSARVVKVMDFGLATMAAELRRAGTVLGTPQYMAPEQASGSAADHRVDVYALGVTLFHLATAAWPFEDGDVLHHHRYTPAPDPRTRRPDVSAALAELILACMAKEPDKRPATAAEIAARLQGISGD
jgi:tRNA A-37 threonylcarbamoyl transferase component Bud32